MRSSQRWLAKINIAFRNRITSLFAGRLPGFDILTHIGQRATSSVGQIFPLHPV